MRWNDKNYVKSPHEKATKTSTHFDSLTTYRTDWKCHKVCQEVLNWGENKKVMSETVVNWRITLWKNKNFTATQIFFSSNQFRVEFLSKKMISRNFSVKMVAINLRNFHIVRIERALLVRRFHEILWGKPQHSVEITEIHSHAFLAKNSWK